MIVRIRKLVPKPVVNFLCPYLFGRSARSKGLRIRKGSGHIDVIRGNHVVRVSSNHSLYLKDIIDSFEYYWAAVIPFESNGDLLVDYSTPRYHDVIGYDDYPILFPSFAEPMVTARQYMDFAKVSKGMTVLDLCAYSGLTSILFSEAVGQTGTVVAIDPDPTNIECIKRNLGNYQRRSGMEITFLEAAVWEHDNGIDFSFEGNMGTSAGSIVGRNRGTIKKAPTLTLSSIASKVGLSKIDFIKCDIEGAESVIFRDEEFFRNFAPRIIIEPHIVNGVETTKGCISDLTKYGYQSKVIVQEGVTLPLIECTPPAP